MLDVIFRHVNKRESPGSKSSNETFWHFAYAPSEHNGTILIQEFPSRCNLFVCAPLSLCVRKLTRTKNKFQLTRGGSGGSHSKAFRQQLSVGEGKQNSSHRVDFPCAPAHTGESVKLAKWEAKAGCFLGGRKHGQGGCCACI